MPPKTSFDRADIIRVAIEIAEEHSLLEMSARSIAEKLGSSTAPIYSQFPTMAALEREVIRKAKDLLLDYAQRDYTNIPFLNMGTGMAIFAREHPGLYRSVFLERADFADIAEEIKVTLRGALAHQEGFDKLDPNTLDKILSTMIIFTHGLATQICVGLSRDTSNQYIIKTLCHVGSAVIRYTTSDDKEIKFIFDDKGGAIIEF